MVKKLRPRSPRLLAWGPATLTKDERDELGEICSEPEFLAAVSHLAGEYRAKIVHEQTSPTQGEVVATLDALAHDARAEIERLCGLDQLTQAALAPWFSHGARDTLVGLLGDLNGAAERAIAAREQDPGVLRRGPRSRIALRGAGKAVRELFKAHGIKWTITEARENSRDSSAIRAYRIVTGQEKGRVAHYLPAA